MLLSSKRISQPSALDSPTPGIAEAKSQTATKPSQHSSPYGLRPCRLEELAQGGNEQVNIIIDCDEFIPPLHFDSFVELFDIFGSGELVSVF